MPGRIWGDHGWGWDHGTWELGTLGIGMPCGAEPDFGTQHNVPAERVGVRRTLQPATCNLEAGTDL